MANTQYERARTQISRIVGELRSRHASVLPTEQELVQQLKVARNTIRKVIGGMVEEGVLERIQGKGTFIMNRINELTFSNWISSELSPGKFMAKLISRFEHEHTGVVIKDLAIPHYQYVNKLFSLILHGHPPDVVQMNSYWLRRFQKLNLFLPLDSYINPQILKRGYSIANRLGQIGDTILALNWTLEPLVLYYNKTVLERAGLDPESPPQTLEELRRMCGRINGGAEADLAGFCLPGDVSEYSFFCVYPLFLAFGGGFSDPVGNVIVDSPSNLRALEWLAALYKEGGLSRPISTNDARILFASNRLGFLIDSPAGRGHFRQISGLGEQFDRHYGVTRMPLGPSGVSESVLLSHSLAISRHCRDPEAAYRWIEYLASDEENAKTYFRAFGMIPCNRNLLHSPFFVEDPFSAVLIQQIESASIGPIDHPLFSRAVPFLLKTIAAVLHHGRDPEEALRFLKESIRILAEADTFNLI